MIIIGSRLNLTHRVTTECANSASTCVNSADSLASTVLRQLRQLHGFRGISTVYQENNR